jgi:N-acylglucosamine-6-phosphate 2-epimerase
MTNLIERLRGSVIVSCQARQGDPFDAPNFIAEFAKSAKIAGAKALRINKGENIRAVKQAVDLPIIGIRKREVEGHSVFITPNIQDVQEVIDAGADIVALDGTARPRPGSESLKALIDRCHAQGIPVLADIATVSDAEYAYQQGADMIATTLAGYTEDTQARELPDFELLREAVGRVPIPVLLEGGIVDPDQVTVAFQNGAHAVIIGKAVTMPHFIARRFVEKALCFKS